MTRGASGPGRARGRELLHPVPLTAVALLLVNDHVLKTSTWAPRVLTGKLSDLAGLFFFPILLVAIARSLRPVRLGRAALAAAALTAVVFTCIKLDARANAAAAWALGGCALDPTDLVALPMTALGALWCMRRQHGAEGPRWARTAAMVVAAFASVATSRQYRPACPAAPSSEVHRSWDALCARTPGATVITTGRSVSLTIDVTPNAPGCRLPVRGLAIDQQLRPGLSARTTAAVPSAVLDQLSRWQVTTELPYPATCGALRLGLLMRETAEPQEADRAEGAIVDVPVVSCGSTESR